MYRMSALLFVGQLICIFSDVLAFDESPDEQAPSSGSGSSWFASSSNPRPASPKSMKRFASEYLIATIGALAVHYLISFAYILLQTFQWRTLNELYGERGERLQLKKVVVIAYANVGWVMMKRLPLVSSPLPAPPTRPRILPQHSMKRCPSRWMLLPCVFPFSTPARAALGTRWRHSPSRTPSAAAIPRRST